MNTKKDFVEN